MNVKKNQSFNRKCMQFSKLHCLKEWELLKAPMEIVLCRAASYGIPLGEEKEFWCHLCAYVCAHSNDFDHQVILSSKKWEKLHIWQWKLVFQAISDLKVLNRLINKPWWRLECLSLILKVILWGTSSCWLASKIIICTFQSHSAVSSAQGLNEQMLFYVIFRLFLFPSIRKPHICMLLEIENKIMSNCITCFLHGSHNFSHSVGSILSIRSYPVTTELHHWCYYFC